MDEVAPRGMRARGLDLSCLANTGLGEMELDGRDIEADNKGNWTNFCSDGDLRVDAAVIKHTVPCLGFVISESPKPSKLDIAAIKPVLERNREALKQQGIHNPLTLLGDLQKNRQPFTLPDGFVLDPPPVNRPGRKVTILGDTFDATNILPLAMDSSLLVHECTNAYVPFLDHDTTQAQVEEKARSHGHSTPRVAGDLARQMRAKNLVLNHLSPRYADPGDGKDSDASHALELIAQQAAEAYGPGGQIVVARDFLTVNVTS